MALNFNFIPENPRPAATFSFGNSNAKPATSSFSFGAIPQNKPSPAAQFSFKTAEKVTSPPKNLSVDDQVKEVVERELQGEDPEKVKDLIQVLIKTVNEEIAARKASKTEQAKSASNPPSSTATGFKLASNPVSPHPPVTTQKPAFSFGGGFSNQPSKGSAFSTFKPSEQTTPPKDIQPTTQPSPPPSKPQVQQSTTNPEPAQQSQASEPQVQQSTTQPSQPTQQPTVQQPTVQQPANPMMQQPMMNPMMQPPMMNPMMMNPMMQQPMMNPMMQQPMMNPMMMNPMMQPPMMNPMMMNPMMMNPMMQTPMMNPMMQPPMMNPMMMNPMMMNPMGFYQ